MKRASTFALLVGVTLLSSVANAQLGVTTATLNATALIDAVLEFDVNDDTIAFGSVAVGSSGCPNVATEACTAQVTVRANSDWDLTFDDFGGSGEDTVTLFVDDFARLGQFIADLTNDAPNGTGGGTAGPDVVVVITGAIRGAGTTADIIDNTDDFGPYLGEFSVTISASN